MESDGNGAEPKAASPLPTTDEAGWGDESIALKTADDEVTLVVKHEKKVNVGRKNFAVPVIPCYVKADLKASLEGELTVAKKSELKLGVKAAGALELGVCGTSEDVTAGPYGRPELSASRGVS